MSRFLADTSIVSILSPERARRNADIVAWVANQATAGNLFLPVVAVAEIEKGIRTLKRRGSERRAGDLNRWLEDLITLFADRIVMIDVVVARIAGALEDRAAAAGHQPGFADILVAATAAAHELIVLTANTRHFAPLGVAFANPLDRIP